VKAARAVSYPTGLLSEATVNDFGAPQLLPMTYVIARNGTIAASLSANRQRTERDGTEAGRRVAVGRCRSARGAKAALTMGGHDGRRPVG